MQASTRCDSDSSTLPEQADDDGFVKRFATLRARAALAGATLHRLAAGGYLLAGRNAWGRELPDLRAVALLLARIDGRSA